MASIRGNYAASVAKGRFSQQAMEERLARITPQLSYEGFEEADIIVEAVFEGMALKKQVFAEMRKSGLASELTSGALVCSESEAAANPRARSAKLRAVMVDNPARGV